MTIIRSFVTISGESKRIAHCLLHELDVPQNNLKNLFKTEIVRNMQTSEKKWGCKSSGARTIWSQGRDIAELILFICVKSVFCVQPEKNKFL